MQSFAILVVCLQTTVLAIDNQDFSRMKADIARLSDRIESLALENADLREELKAGLPPNSGLLPKRNLRPRPGSGFCSNVQNCVVDECIQGPNICVEASEGGKCTEGLLTFFGDYVCSCQSGFIGNGIKDSEGGTGCVPDTVCFPPGTMFDRETPEGSGIFEGVPVEDLAIGDYVRCVSYLTNEVDTCQINWHMHGQNDPVAGWSKLTYMEGGEEATHIQSNTHLIMVVSQGSTYTGGATLPDFTEEPPQVEFLMAMSVEAGMNIILLDPTDKTTFVLRLVTSKEFIVSSGAYAPSVTKGSLVVANGVVASVFSFNFDRLASPGDIALVDMTNYHFLRVSTWAWSWEELATNLLWPVGLTRDDPDWLNYQRFSFLLSSTTAAPLFRYLQNGFASDPVLAYFDGDSMYKLVQQGPTDPDTLLSELRTSWPYPVLASSKLADDLTWME